ncbi:MAG: corrinoid protein-associated methyltransferase CpaM, partial [Planctomycetota bacterium]
MSLFVLMRFLESAPERYDRGMHLLFRGGLEEAYQRLAERILPGQRILDLGCGTGSFGLCAVRRGAWVKGIDRDSGMLAVAGRRIEEQGCQERFALQERGAAELDREESCSRDAVLAGLVFSELGADELAFTLRQVERILKPGGLLLVAEEVSARSSGLRVLHALARAPVAVLTWIL